MPGGLSSAFAVLLYAAQGVSPLPRCISATGLEAAMAPNTTVAEMTGAFDNNNKTSNNLAKVTPGTNNARTTTTTGPGNNPSVPTNGGLIESGAGERAEKLTKLSDMFAEAEMYYAAFATFEAFAKNQISEPPCTTENVSAAIADLALSELGKPAFWKTLRALEEIADGCLAEGSKTEGSETASKERLEFPRIKSLDTTAYEWPRTRASALWSAKMLVAYQSTAYRQRMDFEAVRRFLKRARDRPMTIENVCVQDILCCIRFCKALCAYGSIVGNGHNPCKPPCLSVNQSDVRGVLRDCGEVLSSLVSDIKSLEANCDSDTTAADKVLSSGDPCAVPRFFARWPSSCEKAAEKFHEEFYPWLKLYPALYMKTRPKDPADWTVNLLHQQFESLLRTLGRAIHPRYLVIYSRAQSWLSELEDLYRRNSRRLADLAAQCLECLEDFLDDKDCFNKQKAELRSLLEELKSAQPTTTTTNATTTDTTALPTDGLTKKDKFDALLPSKYLPSSKAEGDQEDARRVTMRYLGWKTLCSERPETKTAAYKDAELLRPLRGPLASISASVAERVKKFSAAPPTTTTTAATTAGTTAGTTAATTAGTTATAPTSAACTTMTTATTTTTTITTNTTNTTNTTTTNTTALPTDGLTKKEKFDALLASKYLPSSKAKGPSSKAKGDQEDALSLASKGLPCLKAEGDQEDALSLASKGLPLPSSKAEGDQEDARRVTMSPLGWKTLCSYWPKKKPAANKDEKQLRQLRGRLPSPSASVHGKVESLSAVDASRSSLR